jgi:uroporphyrin-III C-methyltransferase/precorrin-2 dehydrogenase/sirohydrochlorin ferrochelatase
MRSAVVSLVGAGPGDPELLTLRAVKRIAEADLVLHDALVPRPILSLARRARLIDVGKRAGMPSVDQSSIHAVMVRAARRGERVVRLKGGDPFVLGRGGEEALALASALVPFEIVPGLSSALAAPALAGIPVTHRGISSSVLVLSGHAPSAYQPLLSRLPPGSTTVVVLMGLGNRQDVARLLLAAGWSPSTPVATLARAGTPFATTTVGTLASWASEETKRIEGPATLVVGDVVRVREQTSLVPELIEKGAVHEAQFHS